MAEKYGLIFSSPCHLFLIQQIREDWSGLLRVLGSYNACIVVPSASLAKDLSLVPSCLLVVFVLLLKEANREPRVLSFVGRVGLMKILNIVTNVEKLGISPFRGPPTPLVLMGRCWHHEG